MTEIRALNAPCLGCLWFTLSPNAPKSMPRLSLAHTSPNAPKSVLTPRLCAPAALWHEAPGRACVKARSRALQQCLRSYGLQRLSSPALQTQRSLPTGFLSAFLKRLHSWTPIPFCHSPAAKMQIWFLCEWEMSCLYCINAEAKCWLSICLFIRRSRNILQHLCVKWYNLRKLVSFSLNWLKCCWSSS